MKTTKIILLAFVALTTLVITACGPQAAPTAAPIPTQPPPPTAVVEPPTQAQEAPTAAPAPTQAFAPACQNTTSCAAPDVEDTIASEGYCVQKIPYTNIVVDSGTTFEVLDKSGDFSCADSGQKTDAGKTILTCTGKELFAFDLKLTNPACSTSSLVTGSGQCQEGFGFDAAQGCCAPVTTDSTAGSVTIKVNLRACPLPQ